MKAHIKFILLMIGCGVLPVHAERIYGLERMERLDLLPYFMEGTQVRQVSSHDRDGGNDDGFNGTYSYLYVDENGEYVLFDEMGAGCMYRFWMTYGSSPADYPNYRLRFYFDNEVTPRLDTSIAEFFDGMGAPLEFPLVGPFNTSSHGCYCYLPFPYQDRLKITLDGLPLFYNMTYHRFDSSDGIVSWTGSEDISAVLAQWNATGADPKPVVSNLIVSGDLPLATGDTGTLFRIDGPGAIQSIKFDPTPNSTNILSHVWLQMNWDGNEPEVDVPLGDFFGSGRHEFDVSSLLIGMKTESDWYCYFPMPYWESAEIRLVNTSSETLTSLPFEIQYATIAYDQAKAGYFHALFHKETFGNNGMDFNFIDEHGHGQVVGVSLFMESSGAGGYRDMSYLEGDERTYIDGAQSPCIQGTGTEDYFNGGWYFNQGTFSLPSHGHPWRDHFNTNSPNYTQAYRLHLGDSIPFNSSIRFGIEHGDGNTKPGTYSSVTYYYKQDAPGMILTADLDLGDEWAENVYDYQSPVDGNVVSNTWQYEGDNDDVAITDHGLLYSNGETFLNVPLLEGNAGLLLRRRTDQGVGGQVAAVYVDDAYAGTWYEADQNSSSTDKRWLDSEFIITSNLVAGKTSVRISLVPMSTPWNDYHYWVYCIKPLKVTEDSDHDQLPDEYEMDTVDSLVILDGGIDFDGDGFSDLDEYISGSHPTNPLSYFRMDPDFRFQSEVGRLYTLLESTNLLSNEWTIIRSEIPGTGESMPIPIDASHSAAFHLLRIDEP